MKSICQELRSGLGDLFTCDVVGNLVRVRTPFVYPDGDNIDLFLVHNSDGWVVTDYGEAFRWLKGQSVGEKRELSTRQKETISDICETLGVTQRRGALSASIDDHAQSLAALLVAQAVTRVCDLSFTQRTRSHTNAIPYAAKILDENRIAYRRDVRRKGHSGTDWKVNFEVEMQKQMSLVLVLSATKRTQARQIAEHAVTAWVDLRSTDDAALKQVSLVDDRQESIWDPGHINLIQSVSSIAYLSRPRELIEVITSAA